jgi:hypothetical protein
MFELEQAIRPKLEKKNGNELFAVIYRQLHLVGGYFVQAD